MFKQLTNEEFEDIMFNLNHGLWVKATYPNVLSINILYPEFAFNIFADDRYEFGHLHYDEENNYQNITINVADICTIHRCSISPLSNAEQIILYLIGDIELILETDNC